MEDAGLGSPDSLQRLLLHPLHVGCLIHVLLPQLDLQAAGGANLESLCSELAAIQAAVSCQTMGPIKRARSTPHPHTMTLLQYDGHPDLCCNVNRTRSLQCYWCPPAPASAHTCRPIPQLC